MDLVFSLAEDVTDGAALLARLCLFSETAEVFGGFEWLGEGIFSNVCHVIVFNACGVATMHYTCV